jgi:hypothetical protein
MVTPLDTERICADAGSQFTSGQFAAYCIEWYKAQPGCSYEAIPEPPH